MNRIEEQARYYQNFPLRDRGVKAVVHLEDAEDEVFWNHQLQKASPATYHFLAYSKNDKGNEAHGCEQCLRYKSFLTSRFFICIDSDLRQLRGEKGLSADNFIAQTYAYSWENHFCESEHLQERLVRVLPNVEFDFIIFLQGLSKVVYQPLLYLVHYGKSSELNKQWNITKFGALVCHCNPNVKNLQIMVVFIWKKLQNCLVRPLLTSNKKCHWNMNILMRLMLIFIFKATNFTSLYSTLARYFVMVRMLPLKQTFLTKHFIPKDMPKLIMYNQISLK